MASGVETVLAILASEGFEPLPKPLVVAGTTFEFDAAATGTGVSHDLVVVGGQDAEAERLTQLLSGLSRSLDRLRSLRPVSLVLLGPRPAATVLSQLEDHARVMLIDSEEPTAEEARDAIAVLLPLHLPSARQVSVAPVEELVGNLGESASDEHRRIIGVASSGPEAVREALRRYVDMSFGDVEEEDPIDD